MQSIANLDFSDRVENMGSQAAYDSLELLAEEKIELKNSWTDDFNQLYEIGSQIYFRIFRNCPEILNLFPFENCQKEPESIQNDKAFRGQALKFVQVRSYKEQA